MINGASDWKYDHKFISIRIISEENAELRCWTNFVHLQQTAAINTKGSANAGVQKSKSAATMKALWIHAWCDRSRLEAGSGAQEYVDVPAGLSLKPRGSSSFFPTRSELTFAHPAPLHFSLVPSLFLSGLFFHDLSACFLMSPSATSGLSSDDCWGDARTNASCAHTHTKKKNRCGNV